MGLRENFQKLIDKKQQEIRSLEIQMREGSAYIQALQDSMKLLPRDLANGSEAEHTLREGSTLAKTRDLLRHSGRPLANYRNTQVVRQASRQKASRFHRWHPIWLCSKGTNLYQDCSQYLWPY